MLFSVSNVGGGSACCHGLLAEVLACDLARLKCGLSWRDFIREI